jgi:hypothetical protein
MYINAIHHKKNSTKNSTHNPNFEVLCNFSYFVMNIILSQIYFICWSSPMFVGVFFLNDFLKSKSNPIYFKQTKNSKSYAKMQYLWL